MTKKIWYERIHMLIENQRTILENYQLTSYFSFKSTRGDRFNELESVESHK